LSDWESHILDPAQQAAVDHYVQTGQMPAEPSLAKAVEDFKRQQAVVGRVGSGSASLRISQDMVHGTAFFRFPGDFRRIVFLMSGTAGYEAGEEKLDVTFEQFDRTEEQNHRRHPTIRFDVTFHQTPDGFAGDFFHPQSKDLLLGEVTLDKSWSPVGWLLHVWLSL
jgi:hypothetical protein